MKQMIYDYIKFIQQKKEPMWVNFSFSL